MLQHAFVFNLYSYYIIYIILYALCYLSDYMYNIINLVS